MRDDHVDKDESGDGGSRDDGERSSVGEIRTDGDAGFVIVFTVASFWTIFRFFTSEEMSRSIRRGCMHRPVHAS